MGFFDKLKNGLTKTRSAFSEKVNQVFAAFTKVDEDLFEELEEALITADVGYETSMEIIDTLRDRVKRTRTEDAQQVRTMLGEVIAEMLEETETPFLEDGKPAILLVIGVNGVGKTTSIGKLTSYFKSNGKKVVLAAADTFRAAAIDQLDIWAQRNDCEIIKHAEGADPGAVVFDAVAAAKSRGADVLICDTAGRLHNKKNLMDELGKISRIIDREAPEYTKHVLLVLDATTGQNAISQAKLFSESAGIDGIILTKLDGTAKGGVVIGICREQSIPVRFVGVGEGIDDLQPFSATDFAKALME
ncbi:MAG: signal recognition particle-docking protein FtsY [Clostridia bacterium]|nr:signal recognition particle-docking protein FtsY [Clostridia bacterium]